jgi:hypothetical protein
VAFPNWKYVESRGLVEYDWNLTIEVCFFRGQSDSYDAVSVEAGELISVDLKG